MAFGLGAPELIILLVIFLIIFGVGRLPQVGSALGRGIREFQENIRENEDERDTTPGKVS